MAKSLRSKWRRKCRAVKRVRYGQKERERLKKILGVKDDGLKLEEVEMKDVATVVDAKTMTTSTSAAEDTMETDKPKRVFNTKTLRDQNGSYPVWLHHRKIRGKGKVRKQKAKAKARRKKKN